ncbi:hypothetical protein, partial [Cronobacter malonaticus]|uniref:hypothetical protein n=1 Tax=Cronobacter malonaticus TaxID=413503 RepID=UPI001F1CD2F0
GEQVRRGVPRGMGCMSGHEDRITVQKSKGIHKTYLRRLWQLSPAKNRLRGDIDFPQAPRYKTSS